jgi:hypothetical protein
MYRYSTVAFVCVLMLMACDSAYTPPAARPLSVYIAQATQDVSAAQTITAERVTATFQRQAFNATQTQLALEARAQSTRTAADALSTWQSITATQHSLDGTEIALGKLSLQATATARMWPTVALATSEAIRTNADNAKTDAQTRSKLSLTLVILIGFMAFCLAGFVGFSVWVHISTLSETRRHECAMNKAVEKHEELLNDKLKAEIVGEPSEIDDTAEGIQRQKWITRLWLFFAAGDKLGFSNRSMCPDVLSNRAWGPLVQHLIGCGVLEQDITGTRWAKDYDGVRVMNEFRNGALPFPTWEPPDVKWTVNAIRVPSVTSVVTD